MIYDINDFRYGGKYHNQFWTKENPSATIENCIPNCTAMVNGLCLVNKKPLATKGDCDAGSYHKKLINGWYAIPYDRSKLKVGDIIEWQKGNHVAYYDGNGMVHCSFYTGQHGKAYYNGGYDKRDIFSSTQEVCNFMVSKYPFRFYHYTTIEQESANVGGYEPTYILRFDDFVVEPKEKDETRNQIQVLTDEQYVRDDGGNVLGNAKNGYYNILNTKSDTYTWYEVEQHRWIAGVKNRVIYIPKSKDIIDYQRLYEEAIDKLERIKVIANE